MIKSSDIVYQDRRSGKLKFKPVFYTTYMEFGEGGRTGFMKDGKHTSLPTREYFMERGYKYRLEGGKVYVEEIK